MSIVITMSPTRIVIKMPLVVRVILSIAGTSYELTWLLVTARSFRLSTKSSFRIFLFPVCLFGRILLLVFLHLL